MIKKEKNIDNKEKNSSPETIFSDEKKKEEKKEGTTEETLEKKEVLISSSELDELKKKASLAEEYYDKLLRLGAEFENARKRMSKEREEIIRFANHRLISEMLIIVDDFDRLMAGLENKQIEESIREGVKIIQKRFYDILEKNGLSRMSVVGERFDPTKHEAIMTIETDEYPEDTVVEEIRSGYFFYDKVLRPAIVKVAKKKTESSQNIT